jgi:photosystem II stability/assembly factor-like uncharacterized protein
MKKIFFLSALLFSILHIHSLRAQWTDVSLPYTYALTKGAFVTDNVAYVIADGYPMVFKTTNGGSVWDSVNISSGVGAIDVEFISIDTGFVLVDSSSTTLLKTTYNGGVSWISDTLPAGDYYQMMRFTSATNGFVTGLFGVVYHTINGGQNWTPLPMAGYSSANDKEYTGPDTIIFTGFDGSFAYHGSVMRRDGIGTFQENIMAANNSSFAGTHFTSGQNGYAVYFSTFPVFDNYFIHTSDGGVSWDTVLIDTSNVNVFTDVFMTSPTQGFITQQTNTTAVILKVTGSSTALDYTSSQPLKRLYKGGNTLWAIGDAGKIVKTGLPMGIEPVVSQLTGIYPNPTTDLLRIPVEVVSDVSIVNMNGQVILNRVLTPGDLLSLSGFTPGMYMVYVTNPNGRSAAKIILQK